ncbi:tRNA (adenosine(37)-N6)-threonylcarbamoyltransferase complex dimerization subunit type 1 TsaB [Mycoplasmoides pneumoniae]|uniref:Protease-like protein n=3 Tax=Mycoplasmoides pneumoniae TaxID=2104 RepID=A0AAP8E4Y3_MYCPM|nr:tRNA (adenosine(37)-N6)-threonylcarbamoyltransferase complex dimerization subunit type 1 TsaB [Mycoplasmoides pneumoniae]ADK87017.1 universal bacterial protein YeaZ [Mycoplasmoides pneumoniae FH]AGC04213.1 hypothetical protein C985_0289 [Mycoplasmoides pneumoniae M129-B7]ALA30174.1 hypothetical protein C897_01640 [Mycoplasmoides pneumoniae PI 1428]ALA31126.1 hypothetical protein B434_03135 [Mycoplasmoides pneumoniae 19294]ALA31572.1 hypothetical protein F536_01610 [Mycoplasmoides pneumoniae
MRFFNKYKLFLDCAYKHLNIVLLDFKTNTVVDQLTIPVQQNLTELAVYHLEKLLKKNKVRNNTVRQFYVTTGPGSFTGQRVGAIIAKTWCTVNPNCQLFALNSLRLQIPYGCGISKISAGNEKNYCGLFTETTSEIALLAKPDFVKLCKANTELPLYENFENIDSIEELFLNNIERFELVENPQNLELLYLKDPVN